MATKLSLLILRAGFSHQSLGVVIQARYRWKRRRHDRGYQIQHLCQELFHAGCLFSEQKKVLPSPLPEHEMI